MATAYLIGQPGKAAEPHIVRSSATASSAIESSSIESRAIASHAICGWCGAVSFRCFTVQCSN